MTGDFEQEFVVPPTKKSIIQRLFAEGHITFDEMWVLMEDNDGSKYFPFPSSSPNVYEPVYPWTTTSTTNIKQEDDSQ